MHIYKGFFLLSVISFFYARISLLGNINLNYENLEFLESYSAFKKKDATSIRSSYQYLCIFANFALKCKQNELRNKKFRTETALE